MSNKSTPDDVCKAVLKSLVKGANTYAEIQRDINAGASRTVKAHVKHLADHGYVVDSRVRQGLKWSHKVSLTAKGISAAQTLEKEKRVD